MAAVQHSTVVSGLMTARSTLLFEEKQTKHREPAQKFISRSEADDSTTDYCDFLMHFGGLDGRDYSSTVSLPVAMIRKLCP